ncbi:Glutamate--cysteine ligase EgtA OS=Streptomyces alboniger OX=132473 GN=egtA PE=3 SV=1 [Streptomyces alboniger]
MPEGDCTKDRPPPHGTASDTVTEAEVEALIRGICFKTGPPRALGVELEWLVHEPGQPHLPVSADRLEAAFAALRALPLNAPLTLEPGGQLELSSLPAASLMECVSAVRADLEAVRHTLRSHHLTLSGFGADPWRPPPVCCANPATTPLRPPWTAAAPPDAA